MKLSPVLALTMALLASQAQAQNANPSAEARPTNVTANFQVRMSVDPSAPTTEVTKALAQANQSLGDLANRQCDVLALAFKSDCRVVQLNMSANVNDRRAIQQFNNDFPGAQRSVNASLNATFELVSPADATKNAPAK